MLTPFLKHDAETIAELRAENARLKKDLGDALARLAKASGTNHELPSREPQRADSLVTDAELSFLARACAGSTLTAIANTLDANARAADHQADYGRALELRNDAKLAREIATYPEGTLRASYLRASWGRFTAGFISTWDLVTRPAEAYAGVPHVRR